VEFDAEGRPFSVRYQFLAPMLLNRVQEQQRTMDEQQAVIAALTRRLDQVEARLATAPTADTP